MRIDHISRKLRKELSTEPTTVLVNHRGEKMILTRETAKRNLATLKELGYNYMKSNG